MHLSDNILTTTTTTKQTEQNITSQAGIMMMDTTKDLDRNHSFTLNSLDNSEEVT